MHTVTPRFDVVAEHGEGPLWDPVSQTLYWVDLLQGLFFTVRPGSADPPTESVVKRSMGKPLGVLALREQGGFVMALGDGFALYNETTNELTWLHRPETSQSDVAPTRFNDGAVDPAGRFLAGTMVVDGSQNIGNLYSLDTERNLTRLEQNLYIPNGMNWSLDEKTFFLTDTGDHVIYAYDYDRSSGHIANRRTFIRFNDDEFPDGMTADTTGGFWVAMWSGGCIRRFDASGKPLETIALPVTHPTSCCFGGKDLNELFITTSRLALSGAERAAQPLAGRMLHLVTNVTGQVQRRYRG